MSNKTGPTRDAFTFSLGGLTTVASFVPVPVVADNRIRQQRPDREACRRMEKDSCANHQEGCPSAA